MANVLVGSASVVWLTVDWVDLMSARFVCHVFHRNDRIAYRADSSREIAGGCMEELMVGFCRLTPARNDTLPRGDNR